VAVADKSFSQPLSRGGRPKLNRDLIHS
jgi:hypothetical protein